MKCFAKLLLILPFLFGPFASAQIDIDLRRSLVRAQAQENWQEDFDLGYNHRLERFPMDSTCFFDGLIEMRTYCNEFVGVASVPDEDSVYLIYLIDTIRLSAESEHLYSLDLQSIWPNLDEIKKDSAMKREYFEKMKNGGIGDTGEWMSFYPHYTDTHTVSFDRSIPYTHQRYLAAIADLKAKAEEQGLEISFSISTYPHTIWSVYPWQYDAPEINSEVLGANRYILLSCSIGEPRVTYKVLLIN